MPFWCLNLHNSIFEYRKYHGCPTALLALTGQWKEDLDNHNVIDTVAIDLSKAFDSLPHDLILEKRKFYGFGDQALCFMRSYLSSRHQIVKLGTAFSTWKGVLKGVPQGSVLGPTLCSIFINEMDMARTGRKVSAQINALNNRLNNILPLKTKKSLYRSFILPNFYYCNQVWHHCGKRNTAKIEKLNERALRYAYNDKHASYQHLLERIRLPSMESRRIQDMLLTIHNSISNKAPRAIRNLINLRSFKYNLSCQEYVLSLP